MYNTVADQSEIKRKIRRTITTEEVRFVQSFNRSIVRKREKDKDKDKDKERERERERERAGESGRKLYNNCCMRKCSYSNRRRIRRLEEEEED